MKQQGFTLLELMIVIAIVGILATIAIPAYQDYIVKARVTEGLSLASTAQTTVDENAINGNPLTQGWTTPKATSAVANITINPNGIITIHYTPLVQNVALNLTPTSNGSPLTAGTIPKEAIIWKCTVKAAMHNKYVPANCRI